MKLKSLEDLLAKELRDLYSAEKQLIKALPKMAKAAHSEALAAPSKSTWKSPKFRPSGSKRFSKKCQSVAARRVQPWKD